MPTPTAGPSENAGREFYELLRAARNAWWHNAYPFGLRTIVAIVYNWELNGLHAVPRARDATTEAFARRLWQACKEYGAISSCDQVGPDGLPNGGVLYYLGSRSVVKTRIQFSPMTIESHLNSSYGNMAQAYEEAGRILSRDWQNGVLLDSPYDWGNPTTQSPPTLMAQLRVGNAFGSIAANEIYYQNRVLTDDDQANAAGVYPVYYVITRRQADTLCAGQFSCVRQ